MRTEFGKMKSQIFEPLLGVIILQFSLAPLSYPEHDSTGSHSFSTSPLTMSVAGSVIIV